MAIYMATRRAARRREMVDFLGGSCCVCGSFEQLEIDHVVPGTRSFQLSGYHLDKAKKKLFEEAGKCQLLCKSCHRRKTLKMGETGGGHNKILHPQHGTLHMYQAERCRCNACKEAKRLSRKGQLGYQQVIPV